MTHSGNLDSLRAAYQEHLHRRQGLALNRELVKLIIELQKHRGCTLAILSGDHFFETQLYGIQRDITEQFDQIDHLNNEILSVSEIRQVVQEWVCIRRQWTHDSPEQNFLLHSNLISEALKLVWRVVQRSGLQGFGQEHDLLVRFCFRDWLKMIETTAQARGLATHCAVREATPPELQSRLIFLSKQLAQLDEEFDSTLSSLRPQLARAIAHHSLKVEYSKHIAQFREVLDDKFCSQEKPQYDPDSIYTLGSHAVSACLHVLFTAMKSIETQLSPALTQWVLGELPGHEEEHVQSDTNLSARGGSVKDANGDTMRFSAK